MNATRGFDLGLLEGAARQLAVDTNDPNQLADLTAVAIAVLAWRESPVEDWHAVPLERISNPDMMRGNAATTRLVRDHLREPLHAALSSHTRVADLLASACVLIADLDRRLPDGRAVRDLGSHNRDLVLFGDHVQTVAERCTVVAREVGGLQVVSLLACFAAAYAWRWWLTPTWPRRVEEFMRRIEDPGRWRDTDMVRHVERVIVHGRHAVDHERLRPALLAGPDQLDALGAEYCIMPDFAESFPSTVGSHRCATGYWLGVTSTSSPGCLGTRGRGAAASRR
jgi:hypothetical protein